MGIPWSSKYLRESSKNTSLLDNAPLVLGGALSKRDSKEKFRLPPCIFGIGQWPKQLEHVDLRVETKNFAVCKLSHKSIWFCPQHCPPPKHIWPTLDLCSHRPWLLLLLPMLNDFFFLIHSFIQGGVLWYGFRFSSYLKTKKYATLVFVLYVVRVVVAVDYRWKKNV